MRLNAIGVARHIVRFPSCAAVVILFVAASPAIGQRQVLSGHIPGAVRRLNLQPSGRLDATNRLHLAIGLPLRNPDALSALLKALDDPLSPQYRQYLTPEQFAERFGPTERDYQAVVDFAKANGLQVSKVFPNRALVDVEGTVGDVEKVLHVTLRTYNHPAEGRPFYAPDTEPSLDLTTPILHIGGLDNYSIPHPNLRARQSGLTPNATPNAGSGPGSLYMGNDFRAAYVPGTTLNGSGQNVGLLQFDGYTNSDITYYENLAGLPSVTLSNFLIDGASGAPSGNGGEVEVSLDIEMVLSMTSGGVSRVILYMAPNPSPWEDLMHQMAVDNSCKQISCSWSGGGPDPNAETALVQMRTQGQSFFNATGDSDAFVGAISFPSDSTNVTEVGGTTLTTTGPGGSYVSETAWNRGYDPPTTGSCPANGSTPGDCYVGTSGGISTYYGIPLWQEAVSMASNQGSTTMRNVPDVALTAEDVYVRADGLDYTVGGTSCAAPLWAGFVALANQQATAAGRPTVGFLNPAIYNIGLGPSYVSCFHDITTGNNIHPNSPSAFSAVTGYDLCTGWGTPNGTNLINALLGPPLVVAGSVVSGGNGNGVIDADECNHLNLIVQNFSTSAAMTMNATLATTTPGVTITQPTSSYPNIGPGAFATNTTPFQVSTSPSFVCGTPVSLSLALTYAGGSSTDSFTLPTCTSCPSTQVTDGLSRSSPVQTGRLTRNGTASACNAPKSCPGYFTTSGSYAYHAYSFTNSSSGTVCVTVTLSTSCSGSALIFSESYLGAFSPGSLCSGYLADLGNSATGSASYSFDVPANTNFIVVVNAVNTSSYCSSYTLAVSGLPCYVDGGGPCSISPPAASFTATPVNGAAPLNVSFTDTSTGSPTNWAWNFGDGNTSTLENPSHVYTNTGSYTVQLIASNAGGSGTNTQAIGVYDPYAWWENFYFGNTNSANGAPDADADGAGMSNTNKFLAGFNPTNSAASLYILNVAVTNTTDIQVTYLGANGDSSYLPGIASRTNVLEFTSGADDGSYSNNFASTGQTNILSGGTGLGVVTNMVDSGGATNIPARYYRIRVLVP